MNLSYKIARRYLFAKKSTNAINFITGVAVVGIAIGTAALVLVLSVFNGFEHLLTELYNDFNPDLKVLPAKGKSFSADTLMLNQLNNLAGVESIAQSLEEVALFEYGGQETFGVIKGVDQQFKKVTRMDSVILEGSYRLKDGPRSLLVAGIGLRNRLSLDVEDPFSAVSVFMVKRKQRGPVSKAFKKQLAYPAGTFLVQHEQMDESYVYTNLDFVRRLLGYKDEVSSLEIKLNPNNSALQTQATIQKIVGNHLVVKNRHEQNAAYFKLMKLEKWMGFAILCLMLALIAFNIVGALWMIVMDKRKDIAILRSLGARPQLIRSIFLQEGLLISGLGLGIGLVLALLVYAAQKYQGLISLPANSIIDAYPIEILWFDFIATSLAVMIIGFVAALPASNRAAQSPVLIQGDG
ncbi:MAG: FtsX-like permease family protein [Bacteroidota bacterium]